MTLNLHTVPSSESPPPRIGNRLLANLPEDDLEQLEALCELVELNAGDILFEAGQPIDFIYFPLDTLVSLLAVAEGRMTLEVGSAGREGMIGASVALGQHIAQVRAVVQRSGHALRMAAPDFRAEFAQMESLQHLLHRYTDSLLAQAIQIAVCSRFHVREARLARSLLVTRDRLQTDRFHMTHEFLAHALGVRRVGVTKAASALQGQGLIGSNRGNIGILDPAGLEAGSCHCYQQVRLPS